MLGMDIHLSVPLGSHVATGIAVRNGDEKIYVNKNIQ